MMMNIPLQEILKETILITDLVSKLKNKTLFLTGGTGFFGRSLLDVIIDLESQFSLNLTVFILTRDPDGFQKKYPHLQSDRFRYLCGDIESFPFISIKIDFIFHFATPASATLNMENPLFMFDHILNGSRRILDFAVTSQCEKFIFTSSGAVYGKQPTELTHIPEAYVGAPLTQNTNSAYGAAKRAAELLGNIYAEKHGFEHKIARCFAFVGPHLEPNGTYAIGNFINDAVHGKKIKITGDGSPFRSYLNSTDLVFWLITILLNGKNKYPYNVGSDADLSIHDLAQTIVKTLNLDLEIETAKKVDITLKPDRYVPDITLAKTELGLKVWTPLEPSILQTAAYYLKK